MHLDIPFLKNLAAGAFVAAVLAWIIWINIQERDPKWIAKEEARRAALTQEERDLEDLDDWSNARVR